MELQKKTEKQKLLRKIKRTKERVKQLKLEHGKTPSKDYTYFGGWDLGYFEGKLSALEDMYDTFYGDEEELEDAFKKEYGIDYD